MNSSCALGLMIALVLLEPQLQAEVPVSALTPENRSAEVDLAALQASLQPLIESIQQRAEAGNFVEAARKQSQLVNALAAVLGPDHDFVWQARDDLEHYASEALLTSIEAKDYATALAVIRLLPHLQPLPHPTEEQWQRWSELFLLRWCLNQDRLLSAADLIALWTSRFTELSPADLQRLEFELLNGQLAERHSLYGTAEESYQRVFEQCQASLEQQASTNEYATLALEAVAGRVQVATMQGNWDRALTFCESWRTAAGSLGAAGQISIAESRLAEAAVLRYSGQLNDAEISCRRALVELETLANGESPPLLQLAMSWNELSIVQDLLGEPQIAQQSALTAWQIYTNVLGPDAPVLTRLEGNIAELARQLPLESRQLYESFLDQALERATSNPATPPRVLATLRQTAGRYAELDGDWAAAEAHYAAALELRENTLGSQHHATARARRHLALCHLALGQLDRAEAELQAALSTFEQQLGPRHVDTAMVLADLGLIAEERLAWDQAEHHYHDALQRLQLARARIGVRGLDAVGLSELATVGVRLATLLATRDRAEEAAALWQQLLGASLQEEVAIRQLRFLQADEFAAIRELEEQLSRVTAQRERLLASEAASSELMQSLRQQQDQIEARLIEQKSRLLSATENVPTQEFRLSELQQSLKGDEALIGWVSRRETIGTAIRRNWAVILRSVGSPVWIPLTNADLFETAVDVRDGLARTDFTPLVDLQPRIHELASQIWQPILTALSTEPSAQPIRHWIVMPSPALQGIPLNVFASPEARVSYAPSGAIYVWLQHRQKQRAIERTAGLLAFGDPEFMDPHQNSTLLEANRWIPLPGTRQEVLAIVAACERQQSSATYKLGRDSRESLLANWAARDELRQYRWLHFATHGEANPYLPLRSRLILAHEPLSDDAIDSQRLSWEPPSTLTAESILRSWNLESDLVTLSACESGLGRFTATEGYVGFSQALLLAGSQTVVSSLWKVDDLATAFLMTRFYENLFGDREGLSSPLSISAALSEAQTWLRQITEVERQQLLDQREQGIPFRTSEVQNHGDAADRPYEHPHYWAAFVLIGAPDL